ncbi:hypothetical protein, partial [Escherichia coli]|uniref:hypothetical protein n=1 Tax=Escherichia coli TaxID=562 RepID=UPI0018FF8DDF
MGEADIVVEGDRRGEADGVGVEHAEVVVAVEQAALVVGLPLREEADADRVDLGIGFFTEG